MTSQREYSPTDRIIIGIARMVENCSATSNNKPHAERPYPASSQDANTQDQNLSEADRRRAGRYMRVNHVGEVCAQALYRSQALTARNADVREQMKHAAVEENDHLAWCEQRIEELGARQSALNPLWRIGAFTIGGVAGIAGDRWNLGFVAETERQVVVHLESHLGKLPEKDTRSREVVAQMKADELRHAEAAVKAGAAELPLPVKGLMRLASRVMTATAHWI